MTCLIDNDTQLQIAAQIGQAVVEVLSELPNHGGEEGITPVLGHALMRRSIHTSDLHVEFNYRQLSKTVEEPHAGADGAFLVKVTTADAMVEKMALFQAKMLKGTSPVRDLSMRKSEAERLSTQVRKMLAHTDQAVAIFYTLTDIYVVDARLYSSSATSNPLSTRHRLITLGTYLGGWMPRCTRGDRRPDLIARAEHMDGFKHGLTMDVITKSPPVPWKDDPRGERRRLRGK